MSCGRCGNNQVGGTQDHGRCGNNQVGGTQEFPCQRALNKVKRDLYELERCLLDAAEEIRPPRPCRCCCCCCRQSGNTNGNQTSWGR